MKVKIVGIGKRQSGVAKNGREYDFTPVSFVYRDKGVNGYAAATCNVAQSVLENADPLELDSEREVFTYFSNFRLNINGIL